nr:RNA-directed DNA polymerase, eukaryota [Tanacetum cinerariifolium]
MSSIKAWDETISKMKKRLSSWKLNTLSIGGRLTLIKSVLGFTPIYNMSIFKVPKSVLNLMERLRRNFLMAFKMVIERLLGSNGLSQVLSAAFNSTWSSIINEVNSLKDKGVDLISHCKIKVGKDKMRTTISFSFRRPVRGGVESQQHNHLSVLFDSVILSNMEDRWFCDLNGDGVFPVKDV